MRISIIAAMGRNFVIGNETGLPWRLPKDLRRFRERTLHKPVILGRKTLELIGGPLEGRENVVLTHNTSYEERGFHVAHSVQAAASMAQFLLKRTGGDEVMVIGGGEVYRQFLPYADRMYLTVVEGIFQGTATFPSDLPPGTQWTREHEETVPADDRNPYAHYFCILDRVEPARASTHQPLAAMIPAAPQAVSATQIRRAIG
jgi:dihydrofolate reductase